MGWISLLFVRKVVDFATEDEEERAALAQRVGLQPEAPVDPQQMLGDAEFFALLERIAVGLPGGRAVGVRVGASMRCDEYGAFGLAFKTAVDLAGSYERVERYGKIITSLANFRRVPGDGTTFMEVIEGRGARLGLRMVNELALAAALALSREVSRRELEPTAVWFAHEAPEDLSDFEAHFRCPLRFSTGRDALEIPDARLRTPNRLGDAGVSEFFVAHLDDALTDLPADDVLGRRVRTEISRALSEGVPALSRTARRLGMSARTLQRRLAEQGLAYQSLVDEAREELADRLLRESDYSLAEVAFLTGFSDQSTFGRAFKRWRGQTPRAYRLAARR